MRPPATRTRTLEMLARAVSAGEAGTVSVLARAAARRWPHDAVLVESLCEALRQVGSPAEAAGYWRRLVDANPRSARVHVRWVELLAEAGQVAEAQRCLEGALARLPDELDLWFTASRLADARGDAAAAVRAHQAVTRLAPQLPEGWNNLGTALQAQGAFAEAETALRQALVLRPGYARALSNLGSVLRALGRREEALEVLERAVEVAPGLHEAWLNLGGALREAGREADAEPALRQAMTGAPDIAARAALNLGASLVARSLLDDAEAVMAPWLEPGRFAPDMRTRWAMQLLLAGRFEPGWVLWEDRLSPEARAAYGWAPLPEDCRRLLASAAGGLAHGHLLVMPEQGFGDDIQFCRYASLLAARGAGRVTLAVRRPLARLLASLEGVDEVVAIDDLPDLSGFDAAVACMSLPRMLGLAPAQYAMTVPYLRPPAGAAAAALARLSTLPAGGLRVGVCWRGNPGHENDRERSLPGLATLAPLWAVGQVQFISLQKGPGADEAAAPPAGQPLIDAGPLLADFADTAAVIEALDLLVCVDTSVAHLAGALGRPCLVLLPQAGLDWRWQREGPRSLWYPTLWLQRQAGDGRWEPVIEAVAGVLRALASGQSFTDLLAAAPGKP